MNMHVRVIYIIYFLFILALACIKTVNVASCVYVCRQVGFHSRNLQEERFSGMLCLARSLQAHSCTLSFNAPLGNSPIRSETVLNRFEKFYALEP